MSSELIWFMLVGVAAMVVHADVANGNGSPASDADQRARAFIAKYDEQIRPLEIAVSRAWWQANTSGKDEDFAAKEEAQNRLDAALSNADKFAELKAIRDSKPSDPISARAVDVMYLKYLDKQVPPELLRKISAKSNAIEKAFNVYRAKVGEHELTDSQVRKVLSESKDSGERKAVWEASKGVGPVVIADLKELVRLRNDVATRLGFKNFHVLQMHLNEQRQEDVLGLFDELDELTREPFQAVKKEIDAKLAADYSIPVDELRPWHYHDPFFQEAPSIFGTNLDKVFEELPKEEIPALCAKFYAGIGLPVFDVLSRSDLYERAGKSPHAFCTDIDRQGDVRVLANIVANEYWMNTMLHELGHAVYSSKNIPRSLPWVLRSDAHILATEGVAMMFERFSKSGDWLVAMGVTVPDVKAYDEAGYRNRRDQLIIFSRWVQVMLRFEKAMYENPDQDLNRLWWDLVEKYQGVRRPEGRDAPDFASKIHVVSAPVYYHNYLLGQLFASQVHRTIAREVLKQPKDWPQAYYVKNPAVGTFMRERVFAPGLTLNWNDLTRHATGEPLGPQAFAEEFAGANGTK